MEKYKPLSIPLAAHFKLSTTLSPQNEEEEESMSCVPYANVIVSIMYVMICTHLDISHTISIVSQCMGHLEKAHW